MESRGMPEGLGELSPGPALAAALAALDLTLVPHDQLLIVLSAQQRQLCHDQARLATVLVEIDHCQVDYLPGQLARRDRPNPYGPEETRAALAWTSTAAYTEHALAEKRGARHAAGVRLLVGGGAGPAAGADLRPLPGRAAPPDDPGDL